LDSINTNCPNCSQSVSVKFHSITDVPVNSCITLDAAEEAIKYPTGNIELCFCQNCSFIYNRTFDIKLVEYSSRYQDQQAYSATFGAFQENLVNTLIQKYHLQNKSIMEIGCGKGDFLKLLCSTGNNKGYAIDPIADPRYFADINNGNIVIFPEHYSTRHDKIHADLICCRHTLEHIPDTADFIKLLRNNIAGKVTNLFFEVPNTQIIIDNCSFQDIYYEHCSYFTACSLKYLFETNGFYVESIDLAYNNQYLLLFASSEKNDKFPSCAKAGNKLTINSLDDFVIKIAGRIQHWKSLIESLQKKNKNIVIWGSGSKCMGFLSALKIMPDNLYIVDINPNKQGKFSPGLDIPVVSPEIFSHTKINTVIVMNSIYENEIKTKIAEYSKIPEVLLL